MDHKEINPSPKITKLGSEFETAWALFFRIREYFICYYERIYYFTTISIWFVLPELCGEHVIGLGS